MGELEEMDGTKETVSSAQDRMDAPMNSQTVAARTQSSQVQARLGSSVKRQKWAGHSSLTKMLATVEACL